MRKKTIAIIQARMGSSRLPGKVMVPIQGEPMLWHVVKRVSAARLVEEVVIATSTSSRDDVIEQFARKNKIKIFRGSEDDCLDRYYHAAKKFRAASVVRITADCPLICPEVVDKVVAQFRKGACDYAANTILSTYPDGCDAEIFSFQALRKAWQESRDPVQREHVTPYISNSGSFKLKNVESENPVSPDGYKWSVDTAKDLALVREVYRYLYHRGRIFRLKEIMSLLEKHPQIKDINSDAVINQGYYKSLMRTPKVSPRRYSIRTSLKLKKQALGLIPSCSQTFSKAPSQFIQGVAPVFMERGKGSHVWDVDGNEYIDYAMALGPVILGHNYPAVTLAVEEALKKGTTFSLPHRLEVELAELICDLVPCAEMARFGKNGSDATSAAVRVARAYTGKDKIICCGYHGWQDWYIATTTRNKGVPESVRKLTFPFQYNRIDSLKKLFAKNKNQVACVIMEPVGVEEPRNNFLREVKELTRKNNALLIFDEVVTGFRISLGGAQEYFGIIPDLACFGKAMGNGFPISAVVGKREIMKLFDEVFYSFTFGGEIISIAAAIATIKELKEKNVIQYLWEQGRKIKHGYNVLAKEYGLEGYTQCIGFPPRTVIVFKNKKGKEDLVLKSLFQQECIKRGILFTGANGICFSHSNKDIDYTLRVYRTVLEIIKEAIEKNNVRQCLKGEPIKEIFRKP